MKRKNLDFKVDKLTDSIKNKISGDSFETQILRFRLYDIETVTKIKGWRFDWGDELNDLSKDVYKLTIVQNPEIIQGLISLSVESDHIAMHLLENSPFNIGRKKLYEGVAGNLVAFCCKISFQNEMEGFVAFRSKTKLIEHYQKTLGAIHIGGQKMILQTNAAKILVEKYFKN